MKRTQIAIAHSRQTFFVEDHNHNEATLQKNSVCSSKRGDCQERFHTGLKPQVLTRMHFHKEQVMLFI